MFSQSLKRHQQVRIGSLNRQLSCVLLTLSLYTDRVDIGDHSITISALTTDKHCVNVTTTIDTEYEEPGNILIAVKEVNPPLTEFPVQINQNVTIVDNSSPFRTCHYNSTSQMISTFGSSVTYTYVQTCERALLLEMTSVGMVGVFIDSLDGTFMTTRIGVRLGFNESIVVNAYNRTIIRQSPALSLISFTSTTTKLTISVLSLGLRVEITASGVSVIVHTDSGLQNHRGLCGNANGQFTTRNGTTIDTTNVNNLNRIIRQFMTPPSETFIRMITRRECGEFILCTCTFILY